MAEGFEGMTLDQINIALKNSFGAIKEDMNSIKDSIRDLKDETTREIESIRTEIIQTTSKNKETNQNNVDEVQARIDSIQDKFRADIEFLNESITAFPLHKDANDNDILKTFIEQQIEDIQKQINHIKTNSKEAIGSEKDHHEIIGVKTHLEMVIKKVNMIDENIRNVYDNEKRLKREIEDINQKQDTNDKKSHNTIQTIVHNIDDVASEVSTLSKGLGIVEDQKTELNTLQKDLDKFKKELSHKLQKITTDTEEQFSKHNLTENKNFDTIKSQVLQFREELEKLRVKADDLMELKETSANVKDLAKVEERIIKLSSTKANKEQIEATNEVLRDLSKKAASMQKELQLDIEN